MIELSESQQALQEFGTTYGDGFVETFIPVPSKPQTFSIHLTSNKFIAPGVAIFVYVDGVYQCNRNRQDLKLRKPSDSRGGDHLARRPGGVHATGWQLRADGADGCARVGL